jgi:hypothetical protein
VLLIAAVVAGALSYLLTRLVYLNLTNEIPRSAPLSLLFVGLFELVLANSTRHRLDGRPGSKPIVPLTVARLAALARASSMAAAILGGVWAGIFGYTLSRKAQPPAAGADAITAGLGIAASIVLLVAALLLERVCRVRR